MTYPMDTNQFAAVRAQLRANPAVTLEETTLTSGKIQTKDVALTYFWDGATISINILKRIGVLAHFASDATIFQHVTDDLMTVKVA